MTYLLLVSASPTLHDRRLKRPTRRSLNMRWVLGHLWLVAACSLVAIVVSAGPAQAITFSQQTLPITGLSAPEGLAADSAGDVFVDDYNNNRVVELPAGGAHSGSLAVSPVSGPAGSQISVSSVTPCPVGGAAGFGSTGATFSLYSPAGAVLQSATATLDNSGDWTGRLLSRPAQPTAATPSVRAALTRTASSPRTTATTR